MNECYSHEFQVLRPTTSAIILHYSVRFYRVFSLTLKHKKGIHERNEKQSRGPQDFYSVFGGNSLGLPAHSSSRNLLAILPKKGTSNLEKGEG